MKKFTINCQFGGTVAPFTIYIGKPNEKNHPLQFQAKWLADNRGGSIPAEVMDGLSKIKEIAEKNGVDFEELCAYALQAAITASAPSPDKVTQQQSQPEQPTNEPTDTQH
jgi:hypothetical protein